MAMHGYVSHNQRVNHPTFTQLLGLRRSSVFTCFYASPHGFMNGPCGSRLKMGPQLSLTIIVHANSRWCVYIYILLVGGLEPWNFMTFHILGRIIPTDELIFVRGVETTNQITFLCINDL